MITSLLQVSSGGFRRAAGLLLDGLLPPRCLSCGGLTATAGALCPPCWRRIAFVTAPLCPCCGHPFDIDPGPEALCGVCAGRRPVFARARAVFRYDDASRGLVLGFKHADRTALAPSFSAWMARAGAELLREAEVIVPVPLHPWRLFRRRYNQAALLANALGRLSGLPCLPDALVRLRHTPPQGAMGRQPRRRNVHGAFALRRHAGIDGKRVLLIDDVLTTGATLEECAATLLAGGASAVDVLTLARVVLAHG
jgi:ComF family protein